MIDVFTVIWAALSVLILAALVYFVAKKKISVVAFICLLRKLCKMLDSSQWPLET